MDGPTLDDQAEKLSHILKIHALIYIIQKLHLIVTVNVNNFVILTESLIMNSIDHHRNSGDILKHILVLQRCKLNKRGLSLLYLRNLESELDDE